MPGVDRDLALVDAICEFNGVLECRLPERSDCGIGVTDDSTVNVPTAQQAEGDRGSASERLHIRGPRGCIARHDLAHEPKEKALASGVPQRAEVCHAAVDC